LLKTILAILYHSADFGSIPPFWTIASTEIWMEILVYHIAMKARVRNG